MDDKTAIITGGNTGLGFATAKKFCDNGITTYIIGRNREKTNKACEELGPLSRPVIFDLNNVEQIPKLIIDIVAQTGHIDILVNNAGINMKKDFWEVTDTEFTQIMHTNVLSVFAISREVVKQMRTQHSGNIVNISSMAAQYGIPKVIAYTASKTAIEGMTRSMAVDLSQFGIRVNCVAPGFIRTNMSSKALDSDPKRKEKVLSRTPMGTLGEPEDVANAIFHLISDQAKYTNGVVMAVDGGNSIGF